MRTLVLLASMLVAAPAWAEDGWLADEVASTRFADSPTPGPELRKGLKVEILFREGDKLRVMAGSRIGWVPADAVLDADPAATAPAATAAPTE